MNKPKDIMGLDVPDLPKEALEELAQMYLGQAFAHYGLWLSQVSSELGPERAVNMEAAVSSRYFPRIIDRLFPYLNQPTVKAPIELLSNMAREELQLLVEAIAKTWLTGDGLWFQIIEIEHGMEAAKKINDACWSIFSALEAAQIKSFLGLGDSGGLDALDAALKLRIYSSFNSHESERDEQGALIFRMTACRVQTVRKEKGLEEYPCESAGIAEHSGFASTIDRRIITQCLRRPPLIVPDEGFCTWRFSM